MVLVIVTSQLPLCKNVYNIVYQIVFVNHFKCVETHVNFAQLQGE